MRNIKEICPDLHRDDSPRILLNGKADLRAFKNRFPQINMGRVYSRRFRGYWANRATKVTGEVIEPTIPKDLDLASLASFGTAVVQEKDGEYLVATMDGFLTLDTKSNQISIAEKIETDAGISMKTTGDLVLGVEEFVETWRSAGRSCGRGKTHDFKSDVYGDLISLGGNIPR